MLFALPPLSLLHSCRYIPPGISTNIGATRGIPELAPGALTERDAIIANSGLWDFWSARQARPNAQPLTMPQMTAKYVIDMKRLVTQMRASGATHFVRLSLTLATDLSTCACAVSGETPGMFIDSQNSPLAAALAEEGIPYLDLSSLWSPPDAKPVHVHDGVHPTGPAAGKVLMLQLNKLAVEWTARANGESYSGSGEPINSTATTDEMSADGYGQNGLRPMGSGGIEPAVYSFTFEAFCPSAPQLWFLAILTTSSLAMLVAVLSRCGKMQAMKYLFSTSGDAGAARAAAAGVTTADATVAMSSTATTPLHPPDIPRDSSPATRNAGVVSWQDAAKQMMIVVTITSAAWFANSAMPAGFRPAARLWSSENTDLWIATMMCLFGASVFGMEKLPSQKAKLLSREQSEEWKGWMQLAFVMYHYTNSVPTYPLIRALVSAYVWMTGFGHSIYCWKTGDFSVKRFAKSMWRMNFLVVLLSTATGTPWILYYVVALHSVYFMMVYFSLWVGVKVASIRHAKKDSVTSKIVAIATMLTMCIIVWEVEGSYDAALGPFFKWAFGPFFDQYFLFRTKMDRYSAVFGMVYAAVHPTLVKRKWPHRGSFATWSLALQAMVLSALAAAWLYVWSTEYDEDDRTDYQRLHPYVGMLWVPGYIMLRNCTPWLTARVSKPMMFLGKHSLELYLLQFHLFLNRQSEMILLVIPDERYALSNMVLSATLLCLTAPFVFDGTAKILQAVVTHSMRSMVAAAFVLVVSLVVLLVASTGSSDGCTSGASWGTWAAVATVQSGVAVWCHHRLQPSELPIVRSSEVRIVAVTVTAETEV